MKLLDYIDVFSIVKRLNKLSSMKVFLMSNRKTVINVNNMEA